MSQPPNPASPSPQDQTADLSPASTGAGYFNSPAPTLSREGPGTKIGPYKLLQLIGEGGFGSVFMAQQEHPVQRKVALKIIKLGMDTRSVVARFEQERQALAILDHPAIAKVFDGGATETGRPYFVMEFCNGEPIDTYCDRNNLSISERLELFIQVCQAIQHAHTKGIIHRDLKPSNILVSSQDGKPAAKVIDFGIAKATSSRLAEQTVFTEHRQIIGTPEYMSPEQAEGSLDIDTRTDVYALGVLLYQLLTGTTPFSGKDLRSAAYAEIQRIIREVDPPKPSTRLSENRDTLITAAAHRRTEPNRLSTVIRGELDWIVMKALEKDRTRRYETANGLMLDVRRYITGEAVLAAPPSAVYRIRTFVRRNKLAVAAGFAVAASLVFGVAASTWQARIARQQRDIAVTAQQAESKQRELAVAAETTARTRADQLKKVSEFQAKMLGEIDPNKAGEQLMKDVKERFTAALTKSETVEANRDQRIRTFNTDLDQVNATDAAARLIESTIILPAITQIDTQFKDQPTVNASLKHTLANLYKTLGKFPEAIALEELALEIRQRELGPDHPDTLTSIDTLGTMFEEKGEVPKAEAKYRQAYEARIRVFGKDHSDTLNSMGNLGNILRAQGKFVDAEPLLRESLEGRKKIAANQRDTLISMNTYGFLFIEQGKLKEGEPYWREAYEIGKREFGTDDRDVLVWTHNLAGLRNSMGRYAEALPLLEEVVESAKRVHGLDHPTTLTCMTSLANTLGALNQFDRAQDVTRAALEANRRTLGSDHPSTLFSTVMLGNLLRQGGKITEAEPFLRTGFDGYRRTLGPAHPSTLNAMSQLARVSFDSGDLREAETRYRDLLEAAKPTWGPDHVGRLITTNALANVLIRAERIDEAEQLLRPCLEARERISGPEHLDTLDVRSNLCRIADARGKFADADREYRDLLERYRRVGGDTNVSTLNAIVNLGVFLRERDNLSEAEPLLREALDRMSKVFGTDDARTANTRMQLGRLLTLSKRFADAEKELLEADRAIGEKKNPPAGRHMPYLKALADLYTQWHAAEPAKGYDIKAAAQQKRLDEAKAGVAARPK